MAETPPKDGGQHEGDYSQDAPEDETQKPAKELVEDNAPEGPCDGSSPLAMLDSSPPVVNKVARSVYDITRSIQHMEIFFGLVAMHEDNDSLNTVPSWKVRWSWRS